MPVSWSFINILLYLFQIYKMLGKVWLEIMINGNTLMVRVETVGFGFGGKLTDLLFFIYLWDHFFWSSVANLGALYMLIYEIFFQNFQEN